MEPPAGPPRQGRGQGDRQGRQRQPQRPGRPVAPSEPFDDPLDAEAEGHGLQQRQRDGELLRIAEEAPSRDGAHPPHDRAVEAGDPWGDGHQQADGGRGHDAPAGTP